VSESATAKTRERLEALIGEWTMEAVPPGGPPWPGGGRVTFTRLDGTPLLIIRTHVDAPSAPDSVAVIGCDGTSDTYYQLYTDDRDVQRIYEMSLADGDGSSFATGDHSRGDSPARSPRTARPSSDAGNEQTTGARGGRISTSRTRRLRERGRRPTSRSCGSHARMTMDLYARGIWRCPRMIGSTPDRLTGR
jgi:hypothetical protein